MKVDIQSIHFDADRKLLDFVTRKVSKVNTFSDHISNANVYLKLDRDTAKSNKSVEIKMAVEGRPVFAKESSNTFESATDIAIEKVKIQVKKHKGKRQEKK
jgi:putative sigma-54 modulation protein